MKPFVYVLIVLAIVGGGTYGAARYYSRADQDTGRVSMPPRITWLHTGLDRDESEVWHHLSEGSEAVPITLLEAMISPRTGKPFLHSLAEYGFVVESTDPHRLPVGWSTRVKHIAGHDVTFVGVNCSACHTGELHYRGHTLRIDGAPNMFALEEFFDDLRDSATHMTTNSMDAARFAVEFFRLNHEPGFGLANTELSRKALSFFKKDGHGDALSDADKLALHRIGRSFTNHLANTNGPALPADTGPDANDAQSERSIGDLVELLRRRVGNLRILANAIDSGVHLGPGRGDSFGIIRELLFPNDGIRLDAPVSTPHLFNFGNFEWLHWDGNTRSVTQRNLAQAIALGADYDPESHESSVEPRNLLRLERIGRRIKAPEWPEKILGTIDRKKAARGELAFNQECRKCHSVEKVYPLAEIGTSPTRLTNSAIPVAGVAFERKLTDFGITAETVSFRQNNIGDAEKGEYESSSPDWRRTEGYIARPLGGIWATAPFLHNGSVPTVWDLLQPVGSRAKKFPVGDREYDPVRLGLAAGASPGSFILDTTLPENSNRGHEFGVALPDDSKWDLIEYLKTLR